MKTGVPVCGCPLGPSDSAGVPSGVTGVTVGVYVLDSVSCYVSYSNE